MATRSVTIPDFFFINYTGRPDQDCKRSNRQVRRHVMHNYNKCHRDKKGSLLQGRCERRPTRPVEQDDGQTSRPWGRPSTEPQSSQAPGPKTSSSARGITTFCRSQCGLLSEGVDRTNRANPLGTCLDVCRLDPFKTLPVDGGPQVDRLARWHFYRPVNSSYYWEQRVSWLRLFDNAWRRSHWNAAIQHKGLFHCMMTVSAAKEAAVTGCKKEVDFLFHQGKAMHSITEELSGTLV